ncbi:uncharacterized protein LOC111042422 [Myzus persicae]|uniref:uncharacterized protein LOC111042422 n=1 Tax=Myzus persicae TaxID=13164 RepID=UPI000B937C8C|nr:uncharacterized protein LOC111042422 [Myzus persicae]
MYTFTITLPIANNASAKDKVDRRIRRPWGTTGIGPSAKPDRTPFFLRCILSHIGSNRSLGFQTPQYDRRFSVGHVTIRERALKTCDRYRTSTTCINSSVQQNPCYGEKIIGVYIMQKNKYIKTS